jgi:hypothetical protein
MGRGDLRKLASAAQAVKRCAADTGLQLGSVRDPSLFSYGAMLENSALRKA